MTLLEIDRDTLKDIHNLLSLSAGYHISIEDELEYFDPEVARNWMLAKDVDGRNLGFIRSFQQGSDWSLGELYVDQSCTNRREAAEALLESFKSRAKFNSGHRLRFDIRIQDSELNDAIVACGFSQKRQTFFHFETSTLKSAKELVFSKPTLSQVHEIVKILNFLNPVADTDVLEWVTDGQILVAMHDLKIVSAAHISESDDAIEIVRIATHASFLRKGYAIKLISQILHEASEKRKSYVYLKVEDIRAPAIATYKKAGFIERKSKSQIWHSRWY